MPEDLRDNVSPNDLRDAHFSHSLGEQPRIKQKESPKAQSITASSASQGYPGTFMLLSWLSLIAMPIYLIYIAAFKQINAIQALSAQIEVYAQGADQALVQPIQMILYRIQASFGANILVACALLYALMLFVGRKQRFPSVYMAIPLFQIALALLNMAWFYMGLQTTLEPMKIFTEVSQRIMLPMILLVIAVYGYASPRVRAIFVR